jgi:predicted transcriptional regulator
MQTEMELFDLQVVYRLGKAQRNAQRNKRVSELERTKRLLWNRIEEIDEREKDDPTTELIVSSLKKSMANVDEEIQTIFYEYEEECSPDSSSTSSPPFTPPYED